MKNIFSFSALLQAFFTDRLMCQVQASPETITSYRDTFCLLFRFLKQNLKKEAANLKMEDLNAQNIVSFLCWLEKKRGNSISTRNARLAAIHSFFKYAAFYDPVHIELIQRVLAIPGKRYSRKLVAYLIPAEIEALLEAPDLKIWGGRRDRALLLLALQTGLRVSELIGLNCKDIMLEGGAHVHCKGKGRKERCTPISKESIPVLISWISECEGKPESPLFPNANGNSLSRDGVEYLLRKHIKTATRKCPSLKNKRVSPHVLRHTAAMRLLQHGVDRSVIALWLGHETLETVNIYVHADLKMKEEALNKTTPLNVKPGRYHPDDKLLAFLKNL